MLVFATNGGWKDRTLSEKIEIIDECEVEQLKDENQGDFFAPVCPLDIRVSENGETLVRDPRNNCEFPECDGGDIRVCTEDAMVCKNGKIVGRNPFDDCNYYPCDDVGINPPDESDDDNVMCPMDVSDIAKMEVSYHVTTLIIVSFLNVLKNIVTKMIQKT